MADEAPAWDDIPDWDSIPDSQPQTDAPVAASAAPAWDDIPDWDNLPGGNQPQAEGYTADVAREVAHSVLPAAGGVAAGAGLGTLAAAAGVVNPLAGLAIGAVGMLGGAYVADKAQDLALKKALNYDDDAQRAANREAHPIVNRVAGMAPFIGNPVATLGQRAVGAGMMGAFSAGQQLAEGKFDPTGLALDVGFGAAMPNGNRFTRGIHNATEGAINDIQTARTSGDPYGAGYAPGRPDTQARPTTEIDKSDADTSQSPSVAGNNALAQQPAADPKAPNPDAQVAGTKVKAEGGENASKKAVSYGDVFGDTGFGQGGKTEDTTIQAALKPSGKAELLPEEPAPAPTFPTWDTITKDTPSIRLYRAEQPGGQPFRDNSSFTGGYFTTDINRAKMYGEPKYVDITPADLKHFAQYGQMRDVFMTQNPEFRNRLQDIPKEQPVAKPQADPLAAIKARQAEILQQYSGKRQPLEIKQEFEANRKLLMGGAKPEAPGNFDTSVTINGKTTKASGDIRGVTEGVKAATDAAREDAGVIEVKPKEPTEDPFATKLKERGWNETLAEYGKLTPEEQKAFRHKTYKSGAWRDRTNEKANLKNKLGAEAGTPAERDRHNSAIDAIQKAYEAHPPAENETAAELSERLKAAVNTAHEVHGGNPLNRTTGYRPRNLPDTFKWFNRVQEGALKRPVYWTQDKIDAFKAEENALREANKEYPTQDPKLLDASIEKSRRGGNVAEAVLETKGNESHEASVLDKLSQEKAGGAVKELEQYFKGDRDLEALSEKARKTLDAMPADVRKSGFEAGEPDAAPEHAVKVTDWLRQHFGDPFSKVDTYEDETRGGRVKRTPIKSKADLLPEGDGDHSALTKPVDEKPTKTKEPKNPVKNLMDAPPASTEEYLALMRQAQQKSKSRNAPRPTNALAEDKYSPVQTGVRDLLNNLIHDEKAALNTNKIMADLSAMFKRWGNADDSAWTIKIKPSYIAKRVYSEAQQAGRNIADLLNRTSKTDINIRVGALDAKDRVHELVPSKAGQNQLYMALARKDPSIIDRANDPAMREAYDLLLATHTENGLLFDYVALKDPGIGRKTEDGMLRKMINGGHQDAELEQVGDNADPTAGSAPLSTTRKSPVMERRFAALEDEDGNRHVIHLEMNNANKPNGKFSVWKKYENIQLPDNYPAAEFKKVGDIYETPDGRKFKFKDATEDEIEQNALGNDGLPARYQRDAAASVFTQNAYLRQLKNHLDAIDEIKGGEEFKKYATDKKALKDNKPEMKDWKQSETPGFENYWMDDHLREALEDAYQQGFKDDILKGARNFSRAMTQSIFWIPTAHAMNVEVHWAVGRGWKWLPNDLVGGRNYRDLADTGMQAIKSVVAHDKIQQILHREGAGLIYGGTRSENPTQRLALGVGEMLEKNPGKWEKVADKMGLPIGDLIRGVYKASRHGMWSVNDMFLTQAILERLKNKGLTVDSASSDQIREAIAHIERHIPNYRVPGRIIGGESAGKKGRGLATFMRDPLVFSFGRFRYGMFNSYANAVKDVLVGTKEQKLEAAGHLFVMGAIAFGVYPLLYKPIVNLLTGNDEAQARGRGPVGPILHAKDDAFGRGDFGPLIKETLSLSPLVATAFEAWNQSHLGKPILNPKDVHDATHGSPGAAANVGVQALGWGLGQRYAPVSTLNSALGNPNQGVLGGLRDQALDIKNPSPAATKYEAKTPQRLQKDDVQRRKHPPSVLEKVFPKF